jgi:YVTN family beta-propeller protein
MLIRYICFALQRRFPLSSNRRIGLFILVLAASAACHAQGTLLVAQKGQASLAIVDPVAGKVVASIPEGGITGHEVIASPDGRFAYVPIYGNSGVGAPGTDGTNMIVVDIATRKIVGNVDFGHGVRPHCPIFGPKDGLLYVTTELDKTVSIIDPKTLKIIGAIPTGSPESHMLALSHDGKRGYTANVGPGTVSVLDIHARKTITIIPISGNTQRIAISNDDKWVFTADQKKPQMAVIDTATNTVAKWVPLSGLGYGSAPTPDGRWLIMPIPDKNVVDVVDLKAMQVARSVAVCNYPQEVVVRPDGKTAYVSCTKGGQVAEVDLGAWKTTREIDAGKLADGVAWAR